MTDHKQNVKQRFGQTAQAYVASPIHAEGEDLDLLLQMAAPQAHQIMLDIATGGGHTARIFAPRVAQVIAVDFTMPMLNAARDHIKADNVSFCAADAEALPFPDEMFDLITCRIAAHHFEDCFRFVMESVRCLKRGGRLIVQDHDNAEDERAARYIDAFERLRDPSHRRAYAEYEWHGMFLDAGLIVTEAHKMTRSAGGLITWAKRQRRPDQVIEKLQIMLVQSPTAVRDFLRPVHAGTPSADFVHAYVLIAGEKPA